ncbi:thiamine pyrophosphate-binding protein [Vibrio navarrensis]
MAVRNGKQAILAQFALDGLHHMFGNPGTVEQGFLDALDDYPEIKYILTLHETVAVMAADGYARSTQKPTLVQLHSSPGIGNAVGALYQAKRGHAPLVVIGGDAGLKYMNMDAQMAGDLVAMMEPVTKYATMVLDSKSLLRTVRRAIKIAATPPMGPVYVCLPADILDAPNDEPLVPTSIPSTRVLPDPQTLTNIATHLLTAQKPMIYCGDGVAYSQAGEALAQLAELVGAQVWGCDAGEVNMDMNHDCWQGMTGHMFGEHSLPILRSGDMNLVVGTYMVPEVFPELGEIFASDATVAHIDLNAYEIAKNHRVDIGVVADPLLSLQALIVSVQQKQSAEQKQKAAERVQAMCQEALRRQEVEQTQITEQKSATQLCMADFAEQLVQQVDADQLVVFDEALTSSPQLAHYFKASQTGQSFITRGGSLGVGFPGAIGVKLAQPEKCVVGFSGDGGSMYTIQALYSAVRHGVGAKFVVCNNRSYRLLQLNIDNYWQTQAMDPHQYPTCFDLSYPAIDFCQIAQSMGVEAMRIEHRDQVPAALDRMLSDDKPFLIELRLDGDYDPSQVGVKCGQ